MSFLSKFGSVLVKGIQIALGIFPVVETAIPGTNQTAAVIQSDLTQLMQIITTVESVGQSLSLPGPSKLTAAAPLVAQAILQSSMMVGKTVNDQAMFTKGATEVAQGVVDILNSLHANVQTTSKT